jgi:hypothetical protein
VFDKLSYRFSIALFLASLLFCLRLAWDCTSISFFDPWFQIDPVYAQNDSLVRIFVLFNPGNGDPTGDPSPFDQARDLIRTHGGRVTHAFPQQAIIARVPPGVEAQLADLPGVSLVTIQPIELAAVDIYGPTARGLASMWNSLAASAAIASELDLQIADQPTDYEDALTAPDLPLSDQSVALQSSVTPGYYQTSEYLAGSVAVGIVLVESDGSVDPSTENWTADERQLVFNEIVAALNWWAELEPRANLSFVYDDHFSNPLPTGVEPIARPYYDQQYWIKDALGALGYNTSSYFTRVRDYNNHLRAALNTDWAFTIFVVDSSADADNYFSNGYFAYAYLGGPFLVMTYGNNGYGPQNMDAVAAHEVGHIFYALDQYYGAYQPCTRSSGYLNVENQNSLYGTCDSNVNSIMRGLVYPYTAHAIDQFAAGQVGWRDSDGDNILDPLDTELPIAIGSFIQDGNVVTVTGSAEVMPYPSPTHTSVTINRLAGVRYRFDGDPWQPAMAADGAFDETNEGYNFTAGPLSAGWHLLEVAAVDTAGNVSAVYASKTIIVFDDLDGGLNTVLFAPGSSISGLSTTVSGLAYHSPGNVVANVKYRVNGGAWQAGIPQDGAFDSDYEPFVVTPNFSEAGTYLIEANAIDATGYEETNIASLEIEIVNNQISTIFLPMIRGN